MPSDEPAICPYPGHDTVRCPSCRADIPGVIPDGTKDEPKARCPSCDELIETVIITDG